MMRIAFVDSLPYSLSLSPLAPFVLCSVFNVCACFDNRQNTDTTPTTVEKGVISYSENPLFGLGRYPQAPHCPQPINALSSIPAAIPLHANLSADEVLQKSQQTMQIRWELSHEDMGPYFYQNGIFFQYDNTHIHSSALVYDEIWQREVLVLQQETIVEAEAGGPVQFYYPKSTAQILLDPETNEVLQSHLAAPALVSGVPIAVMPHPLRIWSAGYEHIVTASPPSNPQEVPDGDYNQQDLDFRMLSIARVPRTSALTPRPTRFALQRQLKTYEYHYDLGRYTTYDARIEPHALQTYDTIEPRARFSATTAHINNGSPTSSNSILDKYGNFYITSHYGATHWQKDARARTRFWDTRHVLEVNPELSEQPASRNGDATYLYLSFTYPYAHPLLRAQQLRFIQTPNAPRRVYTDYLYLHQNLCNPTFSKEEQLQNTHSPLQPLVSIAYTDTDPRPSPDFLIFPPDPAAGETIYAITNGTPFVATSTAPVSDDSVAPPIPAHPIQTVAPIHPLCAQPVQTGPKHFACLAPITKTSANSNVASIDVTDIANTVWTVQSFDFTDVAQTQTRAVSVDLTKTTAANNGVPIDLAQYIMRPVGALSSSPADVIYPEDPSLRFAQTVLSAWELRPRGVPEDNIYTGTLPTFLVLVQIPTNADAPVVTDILRKHEPSRAFFADGIHGLAPQQPEIYLTDKGTLLYVSQNEMIAIDTPLGALAPLAYPRGIKGGNDQRGITSAY